MQSVSRDAITRNESGKLDPAKVEDFKAWLVKHGCVVKSGGRKGGAGQYFHVKTTLGWAPVQRGTEGVVITPIALAGAIKDFHSGFSAFIGAPSLSAPENLLVCAPLRHKVLTISGPEAPCGSLSRIGLHTDSGNIAFQPMAFELPPATRSKEDEQYLADLRDDFAVHANLALEPGESILDYAVRRWGYAKVMAELRPAKYGD